MSTRPPGDRPRLGVRARLEAPAEPPVAAPPRPPELQRWQIPVDAIKTFSLVNLTIAIIFGAIAAGGAAAFVLSRSATYQSTTTLLLNHPDVERLPNVNPILRLDALRRTYAALITTEQITVPAALKLGVPAPTIAASITVVLTPSSLVMAPTARSSSREGAKKMAETVSEELINYVAKQQDDAGVAANDRITLTVVDHAKPGAKIAPTGKDGISAAGLGGVIGLAAAYIILQLATAERRGKKAAPAP